MVQGHPTRKWPRRTVIPGLSGCRTQAQTRVWEPFPGVLAQAAITNYRKLGSLSKHLFHTDLEAGKSETKVPAGPVSGEARFLVCRWHLVSSHGGEQRVSKLSHASS